MIAPLFGRRMISGWTLATILGLLVAVALPNAATRAQDVDLWAQQLSSGTFAQREQAMRQLWSDHRGGRTLVERLARHPQPEVSQRAAWVLDRWRIGLLPQLPEPVKRRLASLEGQPVAALRILLDGGHFSEATEVARHQRAGASEEMRAEIVALVSHRCAELVHQGRLSGQMDAVLELLDLTAETPTLVAARALLLERLGRTVDEQTILPACAQDWPQERKDEMEVIGWTVLGQWDRAGEVAGRAGRLDLRETVLLLGGRWREMAALAQASVGTNPPSEATLDRYAIWLMAGNQAGLGDALDAPAEALRTATGNAELRWRSLVVGGRYEDAIAVAGASDVAAAAELLLARQEVQRAFEVLGVDPVAPAEDLQRMLDELDVVGEADQDRSTAALDRLLTALQLLHVVGNRGEIAPTLRRIANEPHIPRGPSTRRRQAVIRALRLGMDDLVPELAANELEPFDSELGLYLSLYLGHRSPVFFSSVGAALQRVRPDHSVAQRMSDAIDLLAGRLPPGWDRQEDLDALHRALTIGGEEARLMRARGLAAGGLNIRLANSRPTYLIGDFFAALGRADLAEQGYAAAAASDEDAAMLRYADVLVGAGRAEDALPWYEKAMAAMRTQSAAWRNPWARPYNSPEPSIMSAMVGQAIALEQMGHRERADELWTSLDLMPLDPAGDLGRATVERLAIGGHSSRQRAVAVHHLRLGAFSRADDSQFRSEAITHALRCGEQDDAESAALWTRIGMLGTAHLPPGLYPSGYVTVPAQWYVFDALAAAERGDAAATREALRRSLDYQPMNIAMAEEDLPKIRQAGMDAPADEALDQVFQSGLEYLSRFPLDANSHNNVAWVAAIQGRHLDEALRLSRHAVFLEPDSTSYRDTLAEVLFRLGETEQALSIERQCLLDQPDLWHLHEQIERFRDKEE